MAEACMAPTYLWTHLVCDTLSMINHQPQQRLDSARVQLPLLYDLQLYGYQLGVRTATTSTMSLDRDVADTLQQGVASTFGMQDAGVLCALALCDLDWDVGRRVVNYLASFAHWMPYCALGPSMDAYAVPDTRLTGSIGMGATFQRCPADALYPYSKMGMWLYLANVVRMGLRVPTDTEFADLAAARAGGLPTPSALLRLAAPAAIGASISFAAGSAGSNAMWYSEDVRYLDASGAAVAEPAYIPVFYPLYVFRNYTSRLAPDDTRAVDCLKVMYRLKDEELPMALEALRLSTLLPRMRRITIRVALFGPTSLVNFSNPTAGTVATLAAAVWQPGLSTNPPTLLPSQPTVITMYGVVEQVFTKDSSDSYMMLLCEAGSASVNGSAWPIQRLSTRPLQAVIGASRLAIARTACVARTPNAIASLTVVF